MIKSLGKHLAAVLATAIMAASSAAVADTIPVKVVAGHPPGVLWVKHLTETFIPAVNKALEGSGQTIEWREFYGGTIAPVGGELEALQAGVAEVGLVPSVFETENLPLQNVSYIAPFVSPDPKLVVDTLNKLHTAVPGLSKSWNDFDVEYLGGGFGMEDYQLLTNFPVTSLADLKDKKIGVPGQGSVWLGGTGATPIEGNLTTYSANIKNGIIQGAIIPPSAALPAKVYEVAPYITKVGLGAQYAGGVVANKDWFDKQSPKVQAALRAGAMAYDAAYHVEQQKRIIAAYEVMTAAGARSPRCRMPSVSAGPRRCRHLASSGRMPRTRRVCRARNCCRSIWTPRAQPVPSRCVIGTSKPKG